MTSSEYKGKLLNEGLRIVRCGDYSSDPDFIFRVSMINFWLARIGGLDEIAKCCGKSRATIASWCRKVLVGGFGAIKPQWAGGRPKRLNEEQREELKETLRKDAEIFGFNVWDGISLSRHIKKCYGVFLGVRQCQNLFHELGFSLIRPHTYPNKGEGNEEERKEFTEKIAQVALDNDNILVFQDEVHFQQGTTVRQMWAPKGSNPAVKSAPGRKSIAYSGYVFPSTGELVVTKPGWFNFETVISSLRELIEKHPIPDRKHLVLVLDNAPWHRKAYRLIVEENLPEYADIREKMTLMRLPAYSPDLNPIEQVWRVTRRDVTHNRYFATLKDLEGKLDAYFRDFAVPNKKLASLCSFKSFLS